jgi:hypothetical protein
VTVARASLDDVYLRHTGRTFSQAEAGNGGNGDSRGHTPAVDAPEPETTTTGSR